MPHPPLSSPVFMFSMYYRVTPKQTTQLKKKKQTNKQQKKNQEKLKEAGLKITSLFLVALTFQSEY